VIEGAQCIKEQWRQVSEKKKDQVSYQIDRQDMFQGVKPACQPGGCCCGLHPCLLLVGFLSKICCQSWCRLLHAVFFNLFVCFVLHV
jgi:hypothetical protein